MCCLRGKSMSSYASRCANVCQTGPLSHARAKGARRPAVCSVGSGRKPVPTGPEPLAHGFHVPSCARNSTGMNNTFNFYAVIAYTKRNQLPGSSRIAGISLVARTRFELVISALRGRYAPPKPHDIVVIMNRLAQNPSYRGRAFPPYPACRMAFDACANVCQRTHGRWVFHSRRYA